MPFVNTSVIWKGLTKPKRGQTPLAPPSRGPRHTNTLHNHNMLVSFKLAILSIPYDVDIFVNLVIMGSSLGVLPDIIVFNTLLFLSPQFLVVGLEV